MATVTATVMATVEVTVKVTAEDPGESWRFDVHMPPPPPLAFRLY